MANILAFLTIATVLSGPVLGFPHKPFSNTSSDDDFFYFVAENGETIQAFLTGGPPPEPLASAEEKTEFWLYKNGQEPGVLISPDCEDCLGTYTSGARLIIFAHGFTSNHRDFGQSFREAIAQSNENVNVVFVNWEKLAGAPWYGTAASNVNPVGTHTARLVNFLIQKRLVTLDKIHFAGHSLGSHVGNFLANNVQGGKIGRITALDPALPLFGQKDDSERIDSGDADFVAVIHTAMGNLPSGLAFTESRGHADFYPNSGKNQPGCGLDAFGSCSHGRANSFFAESIINPRAFIACKCTNWDEFKNGVCPCLDQESMGWSTPSTTRGLFYLRTSASSPFGQG